MADNNTTHRQVYQREELHKKLWEMANSLRNNMEGSEFKNYVLGLLFYRFLSEHEELQIAESNMGIISGNIIRDVHLPEGRLRLRVKFTDNMKHAIKLSAEEMYEQCCDSHESGSRQL